MSEEKPKIRPHRYEQILAVKRPGDELWLPAWSCTYPSGLDRRGPGDGKPGVIYPGDKRRPAQVPPS